VGTFCAFLMKIGPVTITRGETVIFGTIRPKSAYLTKYLKSDGPIFTKLSALVDICVGIVKLAFVLQSFKGRCYGNQLI